MKRLSDKACMREAAATRMAAEHTIPTMTKRAADLMHFLSRQLAICWQSDGILLQA